MNSLTPSEAAFAGGVVGSMMVFFGIFVLAYYLLMVIASWKIFKKAGEPGWKSLIPIYNAYILYKIVGMKKWFWITLLVAFVGSIVTSAMGFDSQNLDNNSFTGTNLVAFLIMIAISIFAVCVEIVYSMRTAKIFGHGLGYTLGLIFLQSLFWLILGFGKSKYDKKMLKTWE